MLGPKTKLVATVHVSNMLGSVTDVPDLADAVHTVCKFSLSNSAGPTISALIMLSVEGLCTRSYVCVCLVPSRRDICRCSDKHS